VIVAAARSSAATVFVTVALTPAAAQCSNIPLKTSLPWRVRGARRVVAVDLDQLDLVPVQAEQRLDVPLLVAALERLEVE
jgi:hypothetical protein